MSRTILRIESSINGGRSVSHQLTDEIIARLTAADPDAKIVTRNLAETALPAIDAAWLGAVSTAPAERSDAQRDLAVLSDTLIAEVMADDVLVIGMPVYNFAIPAQLKSWVDHLARAGVTFRYTAGGPVGLIEDTSAIIAMASGGTGMGTGIDFATPYLRHILGFIGIDDVQVVAADRVASDADAAMNAARDAIKNLRVAA